jgi:hypothetical protein
MLENWATQGQMERPGDTVEDEVGSKEHVHTELVSLTEVASAGNLTGQSPQTCPRDQD